MTLPGRYQPPPAQLSSEARSWWGEVSGRLDHQGSARGIQMCTLMKKCSCGGDEARAGQAARPGSGWQQGTQPARAGGTWGAEACPWGLGKSPLAALLPACSGMGGDLRCCLDCLRKGKVAGRVLPFSTWPLRLVPPALNPPFNSEIRLRKDLEIIWPHLVTYSKKSSKVQ